MTHCRECNSEIAEADTFCPFCGIALAPVLVGDAGSAGDDTPEADPDRGAETSAAATETSEAFSDGGAEPDLTESEDSSGYVDIGELKRQDVETLVADDSTQKGEPGMPAVDADAPILKETGSADSKSKAADEIALDAPDTADESGLKYGEDTTGHTPTADEAAIDQPSDSDEEAIDQASDSDEKAIDQGSDSDEVAIDQPSDSDEKAIDQASDSDEEAIDQVSDSDEKAIDMESAGQAPGSIAGEVELAGEAIDAADDTDINEPEPQLEIPEEKIPADVGFHEDATLIDFSADKEIVPEESAHGEAAPVLPDETGSVAASDEDVNAGAEIIDESAERVVADPDLTGTGAEDGSDHAPFSAEPIEDTGPRSFQGTDADQKDATTGAGESEFADAGDLDFEAPKEDPGEISAASLAGSGDDVEGQKEPERLDKSEDERDERPLTTPNIGGADTDGSKTPKLQPLEEGTVLNDRYEIVRKIGGGGMGAVYLASDKNLGGVLRAVKEMVQSYIELEQQQKAIQDFKRESMLLTSLEHPAIPTIYDYFFAEKEARFYLVMKYISGGDLAARLRSAPEGRLEELSVVQWAIEIADVLAYLHDRQPPIVYRDLKPANIMIDGNSSKVMLIDFGIARWINKEEKGVTAVGTMGYAPPELFSGNVVPSSDIYSLGSTMFHLLTGADPQNNPLLIFDFQKHPRPRQINPNLSDQVEQILMKSVEYNAEQRFSSAAEMRDELDRHLANLKTGRVSYGIKETPKSIALSDQPVFCGFCGQKIVATDMFCAFCGAKQPLAQPGVQSQEYVIPHTTARLMVEGTDELNIPSFDLGKRENLVGRRDPMSNIFPEVDLSKYDPQTKVSRKHARIWREGESYLVEDLGSSNGTIIIQSSNETTRLAPHQSRTLSNGDKIQVGDTTLHFVLG